MTREFIILPEFERNWTDQGLGDKELIELQKYLLLHPHAGDMMEGTGGLRKLRFALPNRGKSGSVRVLYVDFLSYSKIYLITVFGKNEKENLTKEEKNEIKIIISQLKSKLRKW